MSGLAGSSQSVGIGTFDRCPPHEQADLDGYGEPDRRSPHLVDLHDGVIDPTAGSARHGTSWRRWCERPFTGDDGQQPELVICPVEEVDARLSLDASWHRSSSRQCRGSSDSAKLRPRGPSVQNAFERLVQSLNGAP